MDIEPKIGVQKIKEIECYTVAAVEVALIFLKSV